jgi:HPt (histidine-containing phosphotransfer) domain-containing protein
MSRAPEPPAPTPTQLDAAALARLQALDPAGRHGVLRRVLCTYESSLVRQLDQLRAERAAPTGAVVNLAHTLKSSSASVGAAALADACAALEQRLRHGAVAQTHDVAQLIDLGEAALSAVRTMLRQ